MCIIIFHKSKKSFKSVVKWLTYSCVTKKVVFSFFRMNPLIVNCVSRNLPFSALSDSRKAFWYFKFYAVFLEVSFCDFRKIFMEATCSSVALLSFRNVHRCAHNKREMNIWQELGNPNKKKFYHETLYTLSHKRYLPLCSDVSESACTSSKWNKLKTQTIILYQNIFGKILVQLLRLQFPIYTLYINYY